MSAYTALICRTNTKYTHDARACDSQGSWVALAGRIAKNVTLWRNACLIHVICFDQKPGKLSLSVDGLLLAVCLETCFNVYETATAALCWSVPFPFRVELPSHVVCGSEEVIVTRAQPGHLVYYTQTYFKGVHRSNGKGKFTSVLDGIVIACRQVGTTRRYAVLQPKNVALFDASLVVWVAVCAIVPSPFWADCSRITPEIVQYYDRGNVCYVAAIHPHDPRRVAVKSADSRHIYLKDITLASIEARELRTPSSAVIRAACFSSDGMNLIVTFAKNPPRIFYLALDRRKILLLILAARRRRMRHPPNELWALMHEVFFGSTYM